MKSFKAFFTVCLVLMVLPLVSFGQEEERKSTKRKKGKTQTITAPLVKKEMQSKNGQGTGQEELYLQLSKGDVFIKFCESSIEAGNFERLLVGMEDDEALTVEVEVEFKEGAWDICEGDPEDKQSRTGEYVIVHTVSEVKN